MTKADRYSYTIILCRNSDSVILISLPIEITLSVVINPWHAKGVHFIKYCFFPADQYHIASKLIMITHRKNQHYIITTST